MRIGVCDCRRIWREALEQEEEGRREKEGTGAEMVEGGWNAMIIEQGGRVQCVAGKMRVHRYTGLAVLI